MRSRFLVTGGAGFIGSHLVETLVEAGHEVCVLDDFSTGKRENLRRVSGQIRLVEGSICDRKAVDDAMERVDFCLHHAAIASVARSVADPFETNRVNIEGTLNVYLSARDAHVKRVVTASSSAVYGDVEAMPLTEDVPPCPLSPYGVSKVGNELYAAAFGALYGLEIAALRYFNVFGPRQDPNSEYAAAVPKFIMRMLDGQRPVIFGTGRQSRDFVHVDNVVAANIKACTVKRPVTGVYNIAGGEECSVLQLVRMLGWIIGSDAEPEHAPARPGEVERSWADIGKARRMLHYEPEVLLEEGLRRTAAWYAERRQVLGTGGGE